MSDKRFAKLSAGYEAEQKKLEASVKELSAVLSRRKDKTVNVSRFFNIIKKSLASEGLISDILNTFIEKIIVHEADKSTDKRVHKIEIVYNFIGNIEILQ